MRLIHLSDLHVTEGPRLDDHRATLESVVTDALELEPDAWLVTGDLYGHTVPHRSTPAERSVLFPALRRMAEVAPVVVIMGNHDHEVDLLGLQSLGGMWSVRVFTRAGAETILTRAGELHLYALPYPTKRWLLAGEESPSGVEAAQQAVQAKLRLLMSMWASRVRRLRASAPDEPHVFCSHIQVRGGTAGAGVVLAGQEIEITREDLDGLGVDYGALGHLHDRQEPAERCWYVGSLWNTAHSTSELPARAWHAVDIDRDGSERDVDARGRLQMSVVRQGSPCRSFVTLEYRWGLPDGKDCPEWTQRPMLDNDTRRAEIRWLVDGPASLNRDQADSMVAPVQLISDAEVRARLTVPAQHAGGCPWDNEIRNLESIAHRVVPERVVEPVLRVRSPEVAEATTLEDKLSAYWGTLGTPPAQGDTAAALACLDELQTLEDGDVRTTTAALLD